MPARGLSSPTTEKSNWNGTRSRPNSTGTASVSHSRISKFRQFRACQRSPAHGEEALGLDNRRRWFFPFSTPSLSVARAMGTNTRTCRKRHPHQEAPRRPSPDAYANGKVRLTECQSWPEISGIFRPVPTNATMPIISRLNAGGSTWGSRPRRIVFFPITGHPAADADIPGNCQWGHCFLRQHDRT